jgi:hypothetical protein
MLTRFSAALTNRERLLEVVLAVDPSRPFSATLVQTQMPEVGVDKVSHELRKLESMGLIQEAEARAATVDFEVIDKSTWQALRTLGDSAKAGRIAVP